MMDFIGPFALWCVIGFLSTSGVFFWILVASAIFKPEREEE